VDLQGDLVQSGGAKRRGQASSWIRAGAFWWKSLNADGSPQSIPGAADESRGHDPSCRARSFRRRSPYGATRRQIVNKRESRKLTHYRPISKPCRAVSRFVKFPSARISPHLFRRALKPREGIWFQWRFRIRIHVCGWM